MATVSFYETLARELVAQGFKIVASRAGNQQVVLLRGPGGGYLALYYLGRGSRWWGPVPHICADLAGAALSVPWLTWALVVCAGSSGFVIDAEYYGRHHRQWEMAQIGKRNEHYMLVPKHLSGASEFAGPRTCTKLLVELVTALPAGPDGVGIDVLKGSGKYSPAGLA
jgi:hypothetical protein